MFERSGQDIANEMGITRQAVAQTIKRSLAKIYKFYTKEYPELSPFEIVAKIMSELDIEINRKSYNCFPLRIKKLVEKSARNYAEEHNFVLPTTINKNIKV